MIINTIIAKTAIISVYLAVQIYTNTAMYHLPSVVPTVAERSLKLECVTVCVNYSDYLAWILPFNRAYFDKWVIVTDSNDYATQQLCDTYGVLCVVTDKFYEKGANFNKFAGINEGLKQLDKDGWVLHLDCDMFLHPSITRLLRRLDLDEQKLYGCDRFLCNSFKEWLLYVQEPYSALQENYMMKMSAKFPVGDRICQHYGDNWLPLGFFQMWHPFGSGILFYPEEKMVGADKGDMIFANYWRRKDRELLPEIIAIHLDSVASEMGSNWNGRRTPFFGVYNESKI